ncbi:MAG: septal ring lytic transglycosylase RlpA family protein [Ignavibacteria bacterium]|nr:septal ring lytic transglycosylase RlpA family protein [Ignavibacteria bacterium]
MRRKLNIIFLLFITSLFINGCSPALRYSEDVYTESSSNYDSLLFNHLKYSKSLQSEVGVASFYAKKFNGRKTSSGEIFNNKHLTAAHKDFPFNTIIRITNKSNNKFVVVRINDRIPKSNKRIIDITERAAKTIGMIREGITEVIIDVLQWGD